MVSSLDRALRETKKVKGAEDAIERELRKECYVER
mgnify:CR=1 FL=1